MKIYLGTFQSVSNEQIQFNQAVITLTGINRYFKNDVVRFGHYLREKLQWQLAQAKLELYEEYIKSKKAVHPILLGEDYVHFNDGTYSHKSSIESSNDISEK